MFAWLKITCIGVVLAVVAALQDGGRLVAQEAFPVLREYIAQQWQTDEGLPEGSATAIAQTPDGYLWVGTFHGLARFDGIRFKRFDSATTRELPSSRIVRLYLDRKGALWIRSETGELTRYFRGEFRCFCRLMPLTSQEKSDAQNGAVLIGACTLLGEDSEGQLWLEHSDGNCYRIEGDRFIKEANFRRVSFLETVALTRDRWISLWGGRANVAVCLVPKDGEDSSSPSAKMLGSNTEGEFWTRGSRGLAKIARGKVVRQVPVPFPDLDEGSLLEDRRGNVWTCGNGSGLFFVNGQGRCFSVSLGEVKISARALFEDAEGNIWVGTDGAGLFRLKRRTFETFTSKDGLQTDLVKSIVEDGQSRVWVLTGSQATWIEPGTEKLTNSPSAKLAGAWSATADRQGNVWLGTYGAGFFRYSSGMLSPVSLASRLRSWIVLALFEDRDGGIWAAGDLAVHLPRGATEGVTVLSVPRSTIIRALAQDQKGDIYAALNDGGVIRMRDRARFPAEQEFSIPSACSLYGDADDNLWIGSFNVGLSRLKNGKWFRFPSKSDLPMDVLSILEDNDGQLWLGSSQGIYRISRKELIDFADGQREQFPKYIQYTKTEGLGSTECAGGFQPASWRARDGKLWFATVGGASVVDPKTMPFNSNAPPVIIEEAFADNEPLGEMDASGVLRGNPILVPAGTRRVEIHYTALSFTAPEKVRFKYRLDGLDQDWTEVGGRRQAFFQGLRPGDYQFRVIGSNNDGIWNETGASIAVVVLPFYWQTTWFRALAAATSALALISAVRYLDKRKLARKLEQQRVVDEERSRIAKDMHDDLGSSLTSIALLGEITERQLDHREKARESLRKISHASRNLIRAMDEILWALNPKNDTVENLVSFACDFTREHLALASIQCRFDLPLRLPDRMLSAQARHNLLLAVKESINNVAKHSGATEVIMRVAVTGGTLELSIRDNGRGFSVKERLGTGDGLSNLPRRLETIGGECSISSEPGKGTTVTIRLKFEAS